MSNFPPSSPVQSPRTTDNNTLAYMDEKRGYDSMESSDRSELESQTEEESHELLDKDERDLESQTPVEANATPVEYTVSTHKKLFFLGLYFLLNLSVTLSNKALLKTVYTRHHSSSMEREHANKHQVSYPWLLTFSHTFSTSIGCTLLLVTGQMKLSRLSLRENLVLVAFSSLFTVNIAISNVSLYDYHPRRVGTKLIISRAMVSVPFHQVLRSTCPVVTILMYRAAYGRTYSTKTYISMIPLILGVGLATFGDYLFTTLGFALTFLGVLLASLKTVATNRLMTGSLKLPAMELLFRMSPLAAFQCLLYAAGSGEISSLRASTEGTFTMGLMLAILGNAIMAFGLNLVSFQTNKVAGALTISVCGNVKQCLTILLGIVLFNVKIAPLNGLGMLIAVGGAAYYSHVELQNKKVAK